MTSVDLTAFPPKVRATIYYVFGLAGLILGSIQIGYSTAGSDEPVWLKVAFAVLGFLATAFGLVAASNTPVKAQPGQAAVSPIQEDADDEELLP